MKKSTFNIFAIVSLFSILTFVSCKEHEHDEPEPASININISAPLESSAYEADDTVFMRVSITSPSELHGYEIHLKRLADTTEVFSIDKDSHLKNFEITESWVNDGKIHSDMELEVKAIIDHSGNSTSKKVKFHCHEK